MIWCIPGVMVAGPRTGKGSGNGTRLYFGPAYGFYSLNIRHARQPVNRPSILGGFRREIRLDRSYQSYLLIGAEYFFHGVSFRSYYFKPDSLPLYDESFRFNYALTVQELVFPIEFKYLFQRADNKLYSPYVALGYRARALLPANLRITDESGRQVKKDSPDMQFRHPLFSRVINAGVHVALGWQKNAISSSKGSYYVETNFRYGFSQYLLETPYTPSSLFFNSTHVSLVIGLRF